MYTTAGSMDSGIRTSPRTDFVVNVFSTENKRVVEIYDAEVKLIVNNDTLVQHSSPAAVFKNLESGRTGIVIVTHPDYNTYIDRVTVSEWPKQVNMKTKE